MADESNQPLDLPPFPPLRWREFLLGIKTNGAWVIVPPAVLGILVSVVLEVIALIFVVLSGLPGP